MKRMEEWDRKNKEQKPDNSSPILFSYENSSLYSSVWEMVIKEDTYTIRIWMDEERLRESKRVKNRI